MSFDILEPAIDPNNRITFLLDWELTMKCNLDCSYCATDLYGGHNNTTKHPPLNECLDTIGFMFKYVDLYMQTKPKGIRYVILNVYGGESLHHPDIITILEQVRKEYLRYQDSWNLTVTTTTNAIVSKKKLLKIIPLIDEFTVSYHTDNTDKQKNQFKENLLTIKESGRRQKCIVLMHSDPVLFEDSQNMIEWLKQADIKHLPRQLDHSRKEHRFKYGTQQVTWFNDLYKSKSYNAESMDLTELTTESDELVPLANVGRACCGGRSLCKDGDYKSRNFFVSNKFPDWYCSVNHFFLYIKQINGEIFVNKDCKMNFHGEVGPIGNLKNTEELLNSTREQLSSNTMPIIQCKKSKCVCGLCAPKAKELKDYQQIMKKYQRKETI